MASSSKHSSGDQAAAQQRFLSLFLGIEGDVLHYVMALVPHLADVEDIAQQKALTLREPCFDL
jgi:hypothetical protein